MPILEPFPIRYTLTLKPDENRLLLALQAYMQAKSGLRVSQAEVLREAMRFMAEKKNVKAL